MTEEQIEETILSINRHERAAIWFIDEKGAIECDFEDSAFFDAADACIEKYVDLGDEMGSRQYPRYYDLKDYGETWAFTEEELLWAWRPPEEDPS